MLTSIYCIITLLESFFCSGSAGKQWGGIRTTIFVTAAPGKNKSLCNFFVVPSFSSIYFFFCPACLQPVPRAATFISANRKSIMAGFNIYSCLQVMNCTIMIFLLSSFFRYFQFCFFPPPAIIALFVCVFWIFSLHNFSPLRLTPFSRLQL